MEIYSKERRDEILETGEYKGHKWAIRTLGRYPCAYITVSGGMTYEEAESLEKPYCGISYASDSYGRLNFMDKSHSWIGWDFGHGCDFDAMLPDYGGTKHNIDEIRKNIYEVIDEVESKSK